MARDFNSLKIKVYLELTKKVFIFYFFFIYFATNCFAYLDPVSGGILLQILAFIFSFLLFFLKKIKIIFKSFKSFLKKLINVKKN